MPSGFLSRSAAAALSPAPAGAGVWAGPDQAGPCPKAPPLPARPETRPRRRHSAHRSRPPIRTRPAAVGPAPVPGPPLPRPSGETQGLFTRTNPRPDGGAHRPCRERRVLQTRVSRPHRTAAVLPSHLRARRPRSQDAVPAQAALWGEIRQRAPRIDPRPQTVEQHRPRGAKNSSIPDFRPLYQYVTNIAPGAWLDACALWGLRRAWLLRTLLGTASWARRPGNAGVSPARGQSVEIGPWLATQGGVPPARGRSPRK